MTEEQRAVLRDEMQLYLKTKVESLGGDITDGVAILSTAAIEVHASMAVMGNVQMEVARAAFVRILREGYPRMYDGAMEAKNGMVAGTARH